MLQSNAVPIPAPMRLISISAFIVASVLLAVPARALSLRPPTFPELVARADQVIRAEVTATRCEWRGTDANRRIVTLVTLRVEEILVGAPALELELELLGGRVGDDEWKVAGLTPFKVGDRDILFVEKNGRQICPLVGFTHGRYPLQTRADGAELTVSRSNGNPLVSVEDVSLPLLEGPIREMQQRLASGALSVSQFEAAIVREATRLGRPDVRQKQAEKGAR